MRTPGKQVYIQSVFNFVYDKVLANMILDSQNSERRVHGFTDFKKCVDGKWQTFRAHPSYRSRSRQQRDVWYDWALFDLEDLGRGEIFLPGQLLMFVDIPHLRDEVTVNGIRLRPGHPHAVVRLFKSAPTSAFWPSKVDTVSNKESTYSALVEFGDVEDGYSIIPCQFIAEPTMVVPNIAMVFPQKPWNKKEARRQRQIEAMVQPLNGGFFVISPRTEWSDCFSRLIRSFPASYGWSQG